MLVTYKLNEETARWKMFGMHLGIPLRVLDEIDEGQTKVENCMMNLLVEWMKKRGEAATVQAIIKACEAVDNYALADNLRKNNDIQKIMRR